VPEIALIATTLWRFDGLGCRSRDKQRPSAHAQPRTTQVEALPLVRQGNSDGDEGVAAAGDSRNQSAGSAVPIATRDHRCRAFPGTVNMAALQVNGMTTRP